MIGPIGRIAVLPEQLDTARAVSARAAVLVAAAQSAQATAAAGGQSSAPELAAALASFEQAWGRRLGLLLRADEGLSVALGNAATRYPATDRSQLVAIWTSRS